MVGHNENCNQTYLEAPILENGDYRMQWAVMSHSVRWEYSLTGIISGRDVSTM